MARRLVLLALTLFWVVMNVLLWKAEYGGASRLGSAVPPDVLWRKILTAPDTSSLEIMRQGNKIGYCRWSAEAGTIRGRKWLDLDAPPEGGTALISSYGIDLEGNVLFSDSVGQTRFDLGLRFDTNNAWRELDLRINLRPGRFEVHSRAADRTLSVRVQDGDDEWERELSFDALADPDALTRELKAPDDLALFGALAQIGIPWPARGSPWPALKWEAHNDWLDVGHTAVRVYRLETSVLGHYPVVVIISRVGEILRVELPGGVLLINDQLDL
jgi:hypothetical protein